MKYVLDTVTETKGIYTAYVRVEDDIGNLIGTVSSEFTDAADLKKKLAAKLQKYKESNDALEAMKTAAQTVVSDLTAEISAAVKE